MVELLLTRRAEELLQRIFSELDAVSPTIAERWLADVERRLDLLKQFPEISTMWRVPFRKLNLGRELGLFCSVEGRRIILSGIFPLRMDPETISRRLQQEIGRDLCEPLSKCDTLGKGGELAFERAGTNCALTLPIFVSCENISTRHPHHHRDRAHAFRISRR